MKSKSLALKQRIESHIKSKDGCWLTDYAIRPDRRPQIKVDGKSRQLARVVYEVFKNELPGELCVCHTCDNPSCINPEHLWLGTHENNIADMVKKNRQAKGSQIATSKLTKPQVEDIKRLDGINHKEIANSFGVSQHTIWEIKRGDTWKSVTTDTD